MSSDQQLNTALFKTIEQHQWPIVYRDEYNIKLMGLEKLHPFDSQKWGNIFQILKKEGLVEEQSIVQPNLAKKNDLLVVHTEDYLKSLKRSYIIAKITEILPLALIPNYCLRKRYLKPMRYQTGGSILAGHLALERGWSINLGGGFHHCSKDRGSGFCPYADISLLIQFLLKYEKNRVSRVMIVDLDAHQGNGHERDFYGLDNVYVMDVYNSKIYPRDRGAKLGIQCNIELRPLTSDHEYLDLVEVHLEQSLREFRPDIIVYNAGTDILEGDRLGCLSISPAGVRRRDQLVFMKARERRIPIVMLTSGGYQPCTAKVIADSILNLHTIGLIDGPDKGKKD
ncbi:histone deacetylase 11 [Thrips palmi]|uniref:Histone deacetylase 11 n=1 Tax=Thrips palmi TaxID=161013 RepID=A0A6P9A3C9_THRPL|nr:histone deacetylase 11 [Thrips palmi]